MAQFLEASRRAVLTGGVSAALWAGAAGGALAAGRRNVAFQVWRAGQKIGVHTVAFQASGGETTATIHAELVVHVGPIPVFHYRHDGIEVWRDGAFASLESHSVSNGKRDRVSAVAQPSGVRVTDSAGRVTILPADAAPLTHWNRDSLHHPLFNPQTGAVIRANLAQKGGESIALADGRMVPATRLTLSGGVQIVDWYDGDDSWTALRAKADDGSYVDYKRA